MSLNIDEWWLEKKRIKTTFAIQFVHFKLSQINFVESKNGNVNKKVILYNKMAIDYIKTVKYQKIRVKKIHTFYKST